MLIQPETVISFVMLPHRRCIQGSIQKQGPLQYLRMRCGDLAHLALVHYIFFLSGMTDIHESLASHDRNQVWH